jgi:hypothetical protein
MCSQSPYDMSVELPIWPCYWRGREREERKHVGRSRGLNRTIGAIAALGTALAIATPREAQATSTRIYTLGVMNRFIIDDSNKWLYPHIITKYGNLFYLELFGTGPSRAFSAPTSERQANVPPAPPQLNGIDFQTYDAADSVPVQQTAGGGAIVKVTDDIFVSLHLSDYENPMIPYLLGLLAASSTPPNDPNGFPWLFAPPDAPSTANRKFDVFAAYNMQDMMQFGLLFTFGSSKYKRTPNENDPEVMTDLMGNTERRERDAISTSELGFLLGMGLELGDAAAIDAGLGITFHGLTYEPNERNDLISGGGGIELRGDVRALIGVTEWWEVVPAVSFRYMSLSIEDNANFGTGLVYNDDTGRELVYITDVAARRVLFDIGAAGHFRPTDAIDFWAAVGLQFGRWSAEFDNQEEEVTDVGYIRTDQPLEFSRDSISHDAVPYMRFAVEARVFSWLDFRGGVIKFLRADTTTEDKIDDDDNTANRLNDVTRDYPFFDYFVGAAAHYEGFFLDLQVDPSWFMRGPDFLSGSGSNMFINASLGYRF